jgi:hypothetical protein
MANNKMNRLAKMVQGNYDSDEDLDAKTQEEIQKVGDNSFEAEKLRNKGWDNAGAYPKLKRMVKGAWEQDIREKKK